MHQWDASSLPAQRAPRRCSASALPTERACGHTHTRPARPAHVLRLGAGQGRAYYHEASPARDLSQSDGTPPSAEAAGPPPLVRNLRGRHHLPTCAEGPHRPRTRGGPGTWVANAAGPPWAATEAASAMPPHTPVPAVQPDRPLRCPPWCARDLPERTGAWGQYAYCTSWCTRRTRAATPGHGTPHRVEEEAATDGAADPSPCVQRAPQRLPAPLPGATAPPGRRRCSALRHLPATDAEDSALPR